MFHMGEVLPLSEYPLHPKIEKNPREQEQRQNMVFRPKKIQNMFWKS